MANLPQEYCDNMKQLLGEADYQKYIESFSKKSLSAIRINTAKISVEEWKKINPFDTKPVAWTEKGYIMGADDRQKASKHPYYYAGLYYIQEPSAMIPASILPVEKGDKVLDLCAAPGGKATEIAAKLNGTGLLVANDISVSRAMALAKNLQIAGASNAVVTAETPQHLADNFSFFFDKILIDAPCSGEGMFRREPRMTNDWLEKGPDYYSEVQKDILSEAYKMLKPGGKMVYSTCTFAVKEDEEVIQWLMDNYSDMSICDIDRKEGFSEGRPDMVSGGDASLKKCIRIFPHKTDGEGHFAVLLQKAGTVVKECEVKEAEVFSRESVELSDIRTKKKNKKGRKNQKQIGKNQKSFKEKNQSEDISDIIAEFVPEYLNQSRNAEIKKDIVRLPVCEESRLHSLRIIQNGLMIGDIKKKFEPSPQLAIVLKAEDYHNVLDFKAEDTDVIRYLKGETIMTDKQLKKGWVLITVDGYSLGWCKYSGNGMLKNKYYAGWRMQ